MINTSSINPEDTAAQVDGALNLRTQVTFPGTQNCLWFYIIPGDLKLINSATSAYFRETAFAAKGDLVFGGWEFGLGGYYKYQAAPKAMVTASGSIKKLGVFGEAVYQYGCNAEWKEDDDWSGKTSVVQATAGIMYMWKRPSITLTAQYYYDGNGVDKIINMKGKDLGQYPGIDGIDGIDDDDDPIDTADGSVGQKDSTAKDPVIESSTDSELEKMNDILDDDFEDDDDDDEDDDED